MSEPSILRTLRIFLQGFVVACAIGGAALAYAMWNAGLWLEEAAQRPARADAIVILGGNETDRVLRGLELYRMGFAPRFVLTGVERGKDAPPANLAWRAEWLVANGVPKSAIVFESDARNSYEEAVALLASMRGKGWRSVIAVSDPPQMRRLVWTWTRVFEGSGLDFRIVASSPPWWSPGRWWRDERSGAAVITEYIKLAYYVAKR